MQDQTEEFRLLLLRMLAPIRRSHDTPLQFEIDSRSIAAASWQEFRNSDLPAKKVLADLDQIVTRSLTNDGELPASVRSGDTEVSDISTALADWLDEIFQGIRNIDPLAIEILGLRIEGVDNRSISEKLQTGLRLVKQIISDIKKHRVERITSREESC